MLIIFLQKLSVSDSVLQRFRVCVCYITYHSFKYYLELSRSRGSVVGIATSYGLNDQGVGVRVPVGSRVF
jgi:hypothetical protein